MSLHDVHTYDGSGQATSDYTGSLDGTTKTIVTSGAYGSGALTSSIGARSNASFISVIGLSEIAMWERVLNSTEQGQLAAYVAARYAL